MAVHFDQTAHRVPHAPDDPVEHITLSPDGKRLAYSRPRGAEPGLYTAFTAGLDAAGAPPLRVVAYERGESATNLAFSPDGAHVAYLASGGPPGSEPRVGWANAGKPGELGRQPGLAFAWTPKGASLVVADTARGELVRRGLSSGPPQSLAKLEDDGDPTFAPHLAISPDGYKIAATCRRVEDGKSEVWIVARHDDGLRAELLTEVPGAGAVIRPFWSPKGGTVAMLIVHLEQQKSALIAVPKLEGEGVVLHENELLDLAVTPAWAPTGTSIAFFRVDDPAHAFTKSGPPRLVLLDVRDPEAPVETPLTKPGELAGQPHFLDDGRLAIDAGDVVHVLTFATAV